MSREKDIDALANRQAEKIRGKVTRQFFALKGAAIADSVRQSLRTALLKEGWVKQKAIEPVEPPDEGPYYSDGHDWDGFPGGCIRNGCHERCYPVRDLVIEVWNSHAGKSMISPMLLERVKSEVRDRIHYHAAFEATKLHGLIGACDEIIDGWVQFFKDHRGWSGHVEIFLVKASEERVELDKH